MYARSFAFRKEEDGLRLHAVPIWSYYIFGIQLGNRFHGHRSINILERIDAP